MRRALRTVGILMGAVVVLFDKAVRAFSDFVLVAGGGFLLCYVVGWGVELAFPALAKDGPTAILGFLAIAVPLMGILILWAIYLAGASLAEAVADAWRRAGR